ncbi:MAG: hypothetical protein A2445_02465 [Candidatus Jacksonbacteria bacterium RIFOXYC2_FULL_44_29]|nr:MAG: hypothetical protein UW45_C0020G0019 [Parcubacteria group bacterium GW2011_GWC2_44_22]OGY74483.1 MAG: hypothetical protein A2240_02725 [Candidatus Jacksonbacteria bacterium RIFOXYA2_FULL_43_12]OGY77391.1 MAG: hypothetical protein A2295_01675 [Candidatus Jacksonbacteria bacterium RIFOXYB2_FULL_44_15]OGY78163.1 MAG: hypothetical protein A2550_06020 [Candidatus Jacksonbacteria bacterium RIFOXYD2_FULL_43_21]OGY80739.1 MAG: hypothetical protein A2445_02465 [Candidatus Jacksonbacteria bacteri
MIRIKKIKTSKRPKGPSRFAFYLEEGYQNYVGSKAYTWEPTLFWTQLHQASKGSSSHQIVKVYECGCVLVDVLDPYPSSKGSGMLYRRHGCEIPGFDHLDQTATWTEDFPIGDNLEFFTSNYFHRVETLWAEDQWGNDELDPNYDWAEAHGYGPEPETVLAREHTEE